MHKHSSHELHPTMGLFQLRAHDYPPSPPVLEAFPIMIFPLLSLFFHYYFPYYYFPTTIFLTTIFLLLFSYYYFPTTISHFSITEFSTALCHSRTPSTNWPCQGNGKGPGTGTKELNTGSMLSYYGCYKSISYI